MVKFSFFFLAHHSLFSIVTPYSKITHVCQAHKMLLSAMRDFLYMLEETPNTLHLDSILNFIGGERGKSRFYRQ
jgi:hypothetical protein